jgi:hypothetical protein
MGERPRVSIVILSYDRPELLDRALGSIVNQTYRDREILVVDNPSPTSERIAAVVAGHPEARLITTPHNLGFAGGMNVGLRAARGTYVYLFEDDLTAEPECVGRLVAFADSEPACALCAGPVYDRGDGHVLSAGGEVALGGVFRATLRGRGEPDTGRYAEPADVQWLPGCAALGRRDVLDLVGGFREEFFMYLEDVEICLRIRALGFRVCYLPDARVHHEPPAGTDTPTDVDFHRLKNLNALYALHAPAWSWPGFVARYGAVEGLRALGTSRARLWLHLRAWGWTIAALPRLLAERRALAQVTRDVENTR